MISDENKLAMFNEIITALRSLTNEAAGFVSFADPATHGHTNIAVLKYHIQRAQNVLAKTGWKEG